MPGLPTKPELKKLIEEAMQEKAPATHRELTANGTLAKAVDDRATAAQDSYQTALSALTERALLSSRGLTDEEVVSEITQGRTEAARVALDQAVEFDPPTEEATSERSLEA